MKYKIATIALIGIFIISTLAIIHIQIYGFYPVAQFLILICCELLLLIPILKAKRLENK